MATTLIMQGELDKDFAERIHQREQYSTMILDQYVAFPHTKNMLNKLTLALGVFPEKLTDEEYKDVKLVIMLGIPEEMENDMVLVRLYDDILTVTKDYHIIEKIQTMKSYRELLLYIAEENNIFR